MDSARQNVFTSSQTETHPFVGKITHPFDVPYSRNKNSIIQTFLLFLHAESEVNSPTTCKTLVAVAV